ncbi:MAG: hypothetical protein ACRDWI_13390 [Jiangellaceae bacterium]
MGSGGNSANPNAEPPALKFAGFREGATVFTTLVVEVFRNGTVTPGEWQQTALSDATMVWQTNATDGFCIQSAPCTFADFKAQYPNGLFLGVEVAIGSGRMLQRPVQTGSHSLLPGWRRRSTSRFPPQRTRQ